MDSTLTGIEAAYSEGFRWNSLNTFLVYTAESRALAMLEIAVHIDVPTDRYYVEIDIPDDIEMLELGIEDLPENWHSKPPILEPQYIGNDFVLQKSATVLKVPSSIVHPEFNYLINPNHPDSAKIKVISSQNLTFDIRLKK